MHLYSRWKRLQTTNEHYRKSHDRKISRSEYESVHSESRIAAHGKFSY